MGPLSVLTVLLLWAGPLTSASWAQPIRKRGRPLSCPDPSLAMAAHVGGYRYFLACTSDYAPNAYPIRGSNDLIHWHFISFIFPAGHQPWWAVPSPRGHYWSPNINRINGRWVVFFAAQADPNKLKLTVSPQAKPARTWVIGVASSGSLYGPWHTKVLHYRGQFNRAGTEQETSGGVIDPSSVQDPKSGQRYLFWAEQHSSIWAAKLSRDGLELKPPVHQVLSTGPGAPGWECVNGCSIEGPEEYYRRGWFYLFYSGASTWWGSYSIGVAVSTDPLRSAFRRLGDQPILRSGRHWIGPGGSSHPMIGPNGKTYIFFHASTALNPLRVSANRYLMISRLRWGGPGGRFPSIGAGTA